MCQHTSVKRLLYLKLVGSCQLSFHVWCYVLLVAHFGTSALSVPLIVRIFHPTPPSPSFHPWIIHFARTHMIPLYLEQVSYERRNHLRLFRLGLTRVLLLIFVVWMGHLNSIPNCHSGTYTLTGLTISVKIEVFRVVILEKNPSPWDDSTTFWRRPRAKNPTFILVREKKSALLAGLWLSLISKTHVAIVDVDFEVVLFRAASCWREGVFAHSASWGDPRPAIIFLSSQLAGNAHPGGANLVPGAQQKPHELQPTFASDDVQIAVSDARRRRAPLAKLPSLCFLLAWSQLFFSVNSKWRDLVIRVHECVEFGSGLRTASLDESSICDRRISNL